ncbi:MAG: FAD synthase [Candidatus Magasanikbacteria bacterium GW2011_GWA2_37_8]|uniref:FAD synthase n=1 Tax=Candidatus Magasanikbacteria bacterium GW2011_GWA2_37_8 TaxID=1619036 RepID=A0A0G0JWF4_9BACT|nr:MAG: FAD synthase [Candidatus Magasanikbacteria bacterium GW2011_GWA2_37_8]
MVFGTFDIIHPGHIHLLKEAKEYGDFLIAVIGRDATVCQVKGRAPKNDEQFRLNQLKQLNIADEVRLGCIDDKYQVIADEKPDVVALGYDQKEFVDNLENAVEDYVQIVRLSPYMPEVYKSSKLRTD